MSRHLTDTRARNAKAQARPYKLADGHGLYLMVQPTGRRLWRFKYYIDGVEGLFAVGKYPEMTLQQAREAHEAARRLVKQGVHPAQHRKAGQLIAADVAANTFAVVANEWIDQHKADWSTYYLRQVQTIMNGDVFPKLGRLPITSVSSSQLLAIIRSVVDRGAPTVALLIRQWCSAIFRYGIATLRAESDPVAALRGAITKPRVKHKSALGAKELSKFIERLAAPDGTPQVKIALQLLLLTFVRPGELRGAQWCEFDFEKAEWRIPKERMKMGGAHTVPLSRQALALLRELETLSGARIQLFPNVRDPRRCMSPTTLNRRLERMGYSGQFSAHGFRATASTLLNEMGYRPDVIERQLAHQERNKVRASYNHAEYLPERRMMMQEWADFIDREAPQMTRCVC